MRTIIVDGIGWSLAVIGYALKPVLYGVAVGVTAAALYERFN